MSLIAASSIFMIEPLPNCFSICDSAAANAFDLLSSILYLFLGCRHLRQAHFAVALGQHRILCKRPYCLPGDRRLATARAPGVQCPRPATHGGHRERPMRNTYGA